MSHLRVVQITGSKGKEELKILPGTFNTDQECEAAIKAEGDYLFLEVHSIKPHSKTKKTDNGNKSESGEE